MALPVIGHDAVLAAISPTEAIERVRDAFVRHHRGEWTMPAKVYLPCPPAGDFRAMPARGGGLALLKWICSFPVNAGTGRPTVAGVIALSDDATGEPLALIDARSVTALRTGAVAAVATAGPRPGGRPDGRGDRVRPARRLGRALPGGRRLRAGRLRRPAAGDRRGPGRRARLDGGDVGEALACEVVCCVTPGAEPVVDEAALRPGLHLNMLGADGPDKAEATIGAVAACALFCDEWEQASHGGELAGAVGRRPRRPRAGRRPRGGADRRGAGPAGGRRGHHVRLDRPGHPGPGGQCRRLRGLARGAGRRGARRAVIARGSSPAAVMVCRDRALRLDRHP